MKVGDLVRPRMRTGHYMMGIVLEIEPATRHAEKCILIRFPKRHITSDGSWVMKMWFYRKEVELLQLYEMNTYIGSSKQKTLT